MTRVPRPHAKRQCCFLLSAVMLFVLAWKFSSGAREAQAASIAATRR